MNPRYSVVAARAGHRCEYCRAPEAVFNFPFEVEHIQPTSLGGQNDLSNLALSCRSCNVRKSAAIQAPDPQSGELAPLYNPREDYWPEHFHVNLDNALVEGLSATGRATVMLLQINGSAQVAARQQWMRLGIFP